MQRFQNLNQTKEKIISIIKSNGPSLPVHIANSMNITPLFMSAFLSEMNAEKSIKMSWMRVGNSPVYYLLEQEALLENFAGYLNSKEKEAFLLLKEKKVLSDEKQSPSIRVALKTIKDFAVPLNISVENEKNLFWKYFLVSDADVKNIIASASEKKEAENLSGKNEEENKNAPPVEKVSEKTSSEQTNKIRTLPKSHLESEFSEKVKDCLSKMGIETLSVISERRKEFAAKVSIGGILGKQEFYLTAKDKKRVTEDDFTLAIQKAQLEKMPALFISSGEISKKGKARLEEWKNLLRFKKLN